MKMFDKENFLNELLWLNNLTMKKKSKLHVAVFVYNFV